MVARVRRERGCKAGHAGTLDPFATGLLLVLLGRATRLQRFLTGLPKTYLATARLGWRSSTGDPDGELTETGTRARARCELPTGTGPPARADDLGGAGRRRAPLPKAHRGEVVETPEREVEVYRAELLASDGERARYEIECSAGHLHPHPDRDPRRRLLLGAAADRDRALPDRGRRRGARRSSGSPSWSRPSAEALQVAMSIEVTSLPDAEPRPRRVAIGTFDGVHRRPPGGDRGRRHRAHLRPPPARDPAPGGAAEADHAVRGQARRDRRPRGRASWS